MEYGLANIFFDAISNPYVVLIAAVSFFNAITDPTTKGFSDSKIAMTYNTPKSKEVDAKNRKELNHGIC